MDTLAHAPASTLRAGLLADLLTVDEVIQILRNRTIKGPSAKLLAELTGERIVRTRPEPAPDDAAYYLAIATDGKARTDEWTYTRWALCHSTDKVEPAHRYRNGGPVAVVKPTASKAPPVWMTRAVCYVLSAGPMTRPELAEVAEWFRAHRVGTPVQSAE